MKFSEYYVANSEGWSNCVIRSFSKLFNKEYDEVYNELCKIQKELNSSSFNDIEVFETYMKRMNTDKIEYGKDMKVRDLKLDDGSYIVFCFDKHDFYHMVAIIDGTLYDRTDESLDLYVISIYKQKALIY